MRLGQVHRSGPFAGDHVGDVALLELVRPLNQKRRDRAGRQALIHLEAVVGGQHIFADRRADHLRQALPAIFLRCGQSRPAGLAPLPVGFLEAGRSGHRAIIGPLAANLVADLVERLEHLLAELAGLLEHRVDHVGAGVREPGQVGIAADVEDLVENEAGVAHRGGIDGHQLFLGCSGSASDWTKTSSSAIVASISTFWRWRASIRSLQRSAVTLSCVCCASPMS